MNRRHADFQSAALPTELSGHWTLDRGPLGGGVIRHACRAVQRVLTENPRFFRSLAWRCFGILFDRIFVINCFGGNGVGTCQPFAQIDICAAARAKGAVFLICRAGADRAFHANTSRRGSRSRLRVISCRPSVVQPAMLTSDSDLKAARMTWSRMARSFLGIGA